MLSRTVNFLTLNFLALIAVKIQFNAITTIINVLTGINNDRSYRSI